MTDLPDPADVRLTELIAVVRAQAEEIASLDGPRAEAWASDVLALAHETLEVDDPVAALVDALTSVDDAASSTARCALAAFVPGAASSPGSAPTPAWGGAIGTSACEGAWLLAARGAESVAFRFVDADDVRHVVSIDLLPGSPETMGEVVVGPGDLLEALDEDDAGIDAVDATPRQLADRVAAALRATTQPRDSAVANGRLLVARLATLTGETETPPVAADDQIPEIPARDPEDDAYAVDLLVRALRLDGSDHVLSTDREAVDAAVDAIADAVAPSDLAPFPPAVRDAVLALEWADWLGAIVGLVRAGVGAPVDGMTMVDLINRCPEVASTIPKADRARIAWAFDTLVEPWDELGILADGALTERGVAVLPAALRKAWAPTG